MASRPSKEDHAAYMRSYMPAYTQKKREECFDLLGRECVRCSYKDKRALEFDHIDGGGSQHRKSQGNNTLKRYKHIIENPEQYRVLCRNCNWIVHLEKQPEREPHAPRPAGRPLGSKNRTTVA